MSGVASLAQPLSTLAFCWRLERRDGVTIGLTSHDHDLYIGGLRYRAAPGMTPSAIRTDIGLEADALEIEGALTADAITAADLAAGRWDGAALTLWLTQWEAPGELWLELSRGTIGGVERRGTAFAAELAGVASVLDAPVAPATSPDCRAWLGDRDCRVDMAGRRKIVAVASADGEYVVVGGGLVAGAYAFGTLRWMTGAATGLTQAVVDNDADGVWLSDMPVVAVPSGALALLTQGCDRRLATCAGRFANVANFRGEPWLPGNDLLTRYPGG
ncbi:DUF2163 domain-containing protein [Sphingobium aromaticiconvertens]|uniref:DUF2163 domain-containing protein n=1 Tax=Sphingobium aromaticiconvertens TaxID=365341 RepID=UPI00301ABC0E